MPRSQLQTASHSQSLSYFLNNQFWNENRGRRRNDFSVIIKSQKFFALQPQALSWKKMCNKPVKLTWQWLGLINPGDPQDGKAGLLSIQSVHKLSKKRLYYPVKRSRKWLLSRALSQTKGTNFYDRTSRLQSPITASKKGGSKTNAYIFF